MSLVNQKSNTRELIFNSLKATNPIFHEKLVMVSGDISLPNLGLSPLDYEMLTQQVNVIFHLAATVKFDEKMKIAVPINIIGTIEIINLCRKCMNLKVRFLVHRPLARSVAGWNDVTHLAVLRTLR
uniref:Fatty acyl-CoA reductase n=1 Tax=Timema bartmani TaxID=61472 RepID=A0A7R9I6V6_9NEOP|nr:unnamed protein product [Timema bartmani]